MVRRRPELSAEEFRLHWLGVHAPLALHLHGLRGYRINPIVEAAPDLGWDGMGELWFDSVAAAKAAFRREPLAGRIRDDLDRFVEGTCAFFVEEHTIVEPEGPLEDDHRI